MTDRFSAANWDLTRTRKGEKGKEAYRWENLIPDTEANERKRKRKRSFSDTKSNLCGKDYTSVEV
jgi:hypothetical protein